jgi:outer membrane immunogenic protein
LKFGWVVVALAASVSAASAADVLLGPAAPQARVAALSPAYSWACFYIGAMGGYGWSGSDFKGGFAGGTIGGNAQYGNLVAGVEVEGAWAKLNQTVTLVGLGTATDTIQAFGSATGRVGFAADNVMIYGKAGAAAATNNIKVTVLGAPASDTQTHYGYVVGGGVEYGFTPSWSAKGEYLYTHYQSANYFGSIMPSGVASGAFDDHSVKLGIDYRLGWGGPIVAKY